MGQQIAVTEKPSPKAGVRRFEANRSLTGMGHEVFTSAADAVGPRPAAKLARDLLATGDVSGVRVYGNMITVDMKSGSSGAGLDAVVRDLYQYWKPGMELPVFEDVAADAPAAAAAPSGDGGGASGAEAAYLARVPAALVERSRAALAKWKANH
ncbi:MAG TPA: hypothetical protein PLV13_10870 [Ilumatobacteraceae bacterium]|nr:hypothetical protein [Ilumatobacteraceae bacterium]